MAVAVAEEILRVLKGENPIHPVNLSVRENARNRRRSVTQP